MKVSRKIDSVCKICKKLYSYYPYHPRKYCSKSCSYTATRTKFTCDNCSSEFVLKNGDIEKRSKKNGTPRFCTRKCFTQFYENNKTESECLECKIKFKQTLWESKNYRFCSKECKDNYTEMGTLARSYKNGSGIYQKIGIEFWGNKCFHCGSLDNIEVHHLDKNRRHNTPENLRPLCRKCHHAVHKCGLVLSIS